MESESGNEEPAMSECYSFVVNGVPCSTEEEKPLLRYLRDELRLTR